jgi:flagellar hook-associated protein 2
MEAERIPLDKLYQKKQLAEWTQEAYREISSVIKAFSDKYFDTLNSATCMLSQSNYKVMSTTSSNESVLKVTAGVNSSAGSHAVTVTNLATSAVYKSDSGITKDIAASGAADYSGAVGQDFILELDGEKYTVTLDSSVTSADALQTLIDDTVGSGKVAISEDSSGYLVISAVADSGVGKITVSAGTDSALSSLGFSSEDNLCNRLNGTDTLETVSEKLGNPFSFDSDGLIKLTINGVDFEFDQNDTLKDMMDEINSSDAGVTMKYSLTSDTFSITANDTGAGKRISMSETDSTFLNSTGLLSNYTAGEDAVMYLDGEKITRSSNSMTVDGVTYELLSESSTPVSVSISLDTDSIYDKIKAFVEDYNTLIDTINDKISEDYDSDYPPLTEDEKEELSEDEIDTWEKMAKVGLLENDSILKNMLSNMRSALYSSVSGISKTLYSIGITTSIDYTENGKLEINEETLKEAIENNPDEVMKLFSQQSAAYPGTTITARKLNSTEREIRSSEEGLAYKLYDIIQDNISTYTNSAGNKGLLLEKAGMKGDSSENDNTIYNEIDSLEDDIDAMIDKLNDKEDYYYSKFTTMETYISNMNSQLSALQSILG